MFPLRCYFWVLCPGLWLPPASSSLLAAAQWRRGRRLEDFQAFNNHKVCVLSICVVVKYPFEGRIQTPFRYGYDGESRVSNVGKMCQWLWGGSTLLSRFVYKLKIPSDLRPSWGRKRAEYHHYCFCWLNEPQLSNMPFNGYWDWAIIISMSGLSQNLLTGLRENLT